MHFLIQTKKIIQSCFTRINTSYNPPDPVVAPKKKKLRVLSVEPPRLVAVGAHEETSEWKGRRVVKQSHSKENLGPKTLPSTRYKGLLFTLMYFHVYYDRQLTLDVGTSKNLRRLGDEYQHLP